MARHERIKNQLKLNLKSKHLEENIIQLSMNKTQVPAEFPHSSLEKVFLRKLAEEGNL